MDETALIQYVTVTFSGVEPISANGDPFFVYDPDGDLPPERKFPFATLVLNGGGASMSQVSTCVFCAIVAGSAPASVIYEDDAVLAFMGIRPIHPGECMVIPKLHIDHFTDLDDELSQRIIVTAQRIGRRMREVFQPRRVGMVVHGFGVPHAHLLIVPQQSPTDITSARFASLRDGQIVFGVEAVPLTDRSTLDEHARLLRGG